MKRFISILLMLVMICVSVNALAEFKAGDIISFGQIDQDNNNKNGKENIEWIVLENDGEELILLSRYVLTARPFNNRKGNNDYSKSAIRKWLNDSFLKTAFPAKEQKALVKIKLNNGASESEAQEIDGQQTEDRVFLLSYAEVARYFPEKGDRRAVYTDAAIKAYNDGSMSFDDLKASMQKYRDGCGSWYLRTVRDGFMGMDGYYPEVIQDDGDTSMLGASPVLNIGVRPAVVVNIQKAEGLIELVSNGKITINKEKYCDTYYLRKIKSNMTAKKMISDGSEAVMAALIYVDIEHEVKNHSDSPVFLMKAPILDSLNDRPVYAGLDQKENGFAALPIMGGGYQVFTWQQKEIIKWGAFSDEELPDVLALMKESREIDWYYFFGSLQGVWESFKIQ